MPLERLPSSGFEVSLIAAQYRGSALYPSFVHLNHSVSMLHADVLALLYHVARYTRAPLLELGAFIGGSTIALARGAADAGRGCKVVSVETGGASDHERYATPDIVAAFRSNLAARDLAAHVRLVVGYSRDPGVVAEVARQGRFGCVLIDADGHVEDDLALYGALVLPGALLIVDDYYSPGAPEKELTTRRQIDRLAARGLLEAFCVQGWGTWIGRFL
jgi:predicted O-methyltransferase YrrM